jgi:hypothetical protein
MRRFTLAVPIGVSLVALALAPASSQAAPRFLNAIWGPIKFAPGAGGCPTGGDRCSAFPLYEQLGAEVFEYQLQWNRVAPTRPTQPGNPGDPAYVWPNEVQFAVDTAAAAGIKVMFLVKNSPKWANGGRAARWAPRPAALAAFLHAAALKYPSVRHWEVLGETNRRLTFMPQGRKGARTYARILDAAYRALKRVRRRNVVIGGMTLSGGSRRAVTPAPFWIRNLRVRGRRPPHMDWFGHNPYDALYRKRGKGGKRRWIFNRGRPRKLWLSEWTIQSDHPSYAFSFSVSRRKQARWLRAGYALARRLPYVIGLGWYQLADKEPDPNNPNWGLITYSGAKKPSFAAYRSLP